MKILFLDIDGVLNSEQSSIAYQRDIGLLQLTGPLREHYLCPLAVSNLRMIVDQLPNLRIVISSSWRLNRSIAELQALFELIGFHRELIVDVTPQLPDHSRPGEIALWLSSRAPKDVDYVIVDDDPSDFREMDEHLVRTSVLEGLMYRDARRIMSRFRP